jgi:hypothetical protein
MRILSLFESDVGITILSIIWGLALSTIFTVSCEYGNCRKVYYVGPKIDTNNTDIWNFGTNQCYTVKPYIVNCTDEVLNTLN